MVDARSQSATLRYLLDEEDEFEDEIDEYVSVQLAHVRATRYYARLPTYRKRLGRWHALLNDHVSCNNTEFLEHFRVQRPAFRRIVDLIKHDDVFQTAPHRTFRGGVELHLMVLLKFLGSCGNENTSSKNALFFGFGKAPRTTTLSAPLRLYSSSVTPSSHGPTRTNDSRLLGASNRRLASPIASE